MRSGRKLLVWRFYLFLCCTGQYFLEFPHLLPCPYPSAGMLYDPSPALPLSICRHAVWSISCPALLSVSRLAAGDVACIIIPHPNVCLIFVFRMAPRQSFHPSGRFATLRTFSPITCRQIWSWGVALHHRPAGQQDEEGGAHQVPLHRPGILYRWVYLSVVDLIWWGAPPPHFNL